MRKLLQGKSIFFLRFLFLCQSYLKMVIVFKFYLIGFFSILLCLLIFICLATNAGLMPQNHLLAGLTYVPEAFLYPIILLFGVLLWAFGHRILPFFLCYCSLAYVLFLGDFSLLGMARAMQSNFQGNLQIKKTPQPQIAPGMAGLLPKQDSRFSVLSLNLRYFSFGYRHIVKEIQKSDTDFILLSENVASLEEQSYLLEQDFGYFARLGKQSETGILSRYPIVAAKEVELPTNQASLEFANDLPMQQKNQKRSFLHLVADVHGRRLHVISVRFVAGRPPSNSLRDTLQWGKYLMNAQKAEVDFFEEYISHVTEPLIFGGDLNATPGSFVVQRLRRKATDAWLATHFWGTPTFSTLKFPFMTLDYLFAKNGLVPLASEKLTMLVSDHEIVRSTFAMPTEKPTVPSFASWKESQSSHSWETQNGKVGL